MTKSFKVRLAACLPWLLAFGCAEGDATMMAVDAEGDASGPTDVYADPVTGSDASEPVREPEPAPWVDAGVTLVDAAVTPMPSDDDAMVSEPALDAGHTPLGCVETFVFDPGNRQDIQSVVLAGGSPLSWAPTASAGGRPLTLGEDGLYRVEVQMLPGVVPYKFVVNGSEWIADAAACEDQDDTYGGRNSLRYACEERPSCHGGDAGAQVDAGEGALDAGHAGSDAGVASDAGVVTDAGAPAGDASSARDASYDLPDAALAADAGSPMADEALDPCGCEPLLIWLDLSTVSDANPSPVTAVQIRGEVEVLGSWGAPGVSLAEVEAGVWAGYVARGLADVEYKLVVVHADGSESWMLDPNSCEATRNTNSVLDGCFDGPASCDAELDAPLSTPPLVSDACADDCEVEVAVPASSVGDAVSVDLVGEYPLIWNESDGLPLLLGADGVWRLTLRMPAGVHEYKLVLDGQSVVTDPANCAVQEGPYQNSLLYACEAAPACE